MQIIQRYECVNNIKNIIGLEWSAFMFSGEVPATLLDIPFDITDISALHLNAQSIGLMDYESDDANFKISALVGPKGRTPLRFVTDENGTALMPARITYSGKPYDTTANQLFDETSAANYYYLNEDHIGDYIEFEFDRPVTATKLALDQYAHSYYYASGIDIQAYINDAWVETDSVSLVAGNNLVDATAPQATTKYRVILRGDGHASYKAQLLRARLYVSESFEEADMPTIEPITWAVLAPRNAIDEAHIGVVSPRMIEPVGGPVDGAAMTLRQTTLGRTEYPGIMYHKVQFNDLEEA